MLGRGRGAPAHISGANQELGTATTKGPDRKSKTIQGVVVSDRMQKTVVVRVERLVQHQKYGKYIRRYSKHKAHDEREVAKLGDRVEIAACRPLSKTKFWHVVQVLH